MKEFKSAHSKMFSKRKAVEVTEKVNQIATTDRLSGSTASAMV